MPLTSYSDYRLSFTPTSYRQSYAPTYIPTRRKVTLQEAFRLVVQGEITASEVFRQCPAAVQQIIDGACHQAFGEKFRILSSERQTSVFAALLLAVQSAGNTLPANPEPARPKRWWQFWR